MPRQSKHYPGIPGKIGRPRGARNKTRSGLLGGVGSHVPLGPRSAHLFADTRDFVQRLIWIKPKEGPKVKLIFNEEQNRLYNDLCGNDIIVKPRQIGITTFFCAVYLAEAIMTEGLRVVITAHEWSAAKAIKVHMIDVMLNSLPPEIAPTVSTDNAYEIHFLDHGSSLEVHCLTGAKGRSGTIHRLHQTEAAFSKSSSAGLTEAVPRTGKISVESTGDDPSGEFYEAVMAASKGDSAEKLHFFRWIEHSEYRIKDDSGEQNIPIPAYDSKLIINSPAFAKYKKAMDAGADWDQIRWYMWKENTKSMIEPGRMQREYPLEVEDAFMMGGNPFFDPNLVQLLQATLIAKNKEAGNPDNKPLITATMGMVKGVKIWEKPIPGHIYVGGIDVAEGVSKAYSAVTIIDVSTLKVVCTYQSNQIDPTDLGDLVAEVGKYYNWAFLGVERNNHGHAVLGVLVKIHRYRQLYRFRAYNKTTRTFEHKVGWQTDVTSRQTLFSELRIALNRGLPVILDLEWLKDFQFINSVGGKAEPSMGKTGDITISVAIALQMFKFKLGKSEQALTEHVLIGPSDNVRNQIRCASDGISVAKNEDLGIYEVSPSNMDFQKEKW